MINRPVRYGRPPARTAAAVGYIAPIVAALGVGCATTPDLHLAGMVARGDYGAARVYSDRIVARRHGAGGDIDRATVLNRMRQVIATLADGYVDGHESDVLSLFDLLRQQGLNRDRTTAAVVLYEGIRLWKGEPFEQAMAYHYIALHYALRGQWGNVRAATDNALFHLRDFGNGNAASNPTATDLVRHATADPEYLDHGYVAVPSDFTLGHLMFAVAALRLGRGDEARDHFDHALRCAPALAPTVKQLRRGNYDTLLLVDYGFGPAKIATGPDGAVAAFAPRTASDDQVLRVDLGDGHAPSAHAAVADLNHMAAHHRWRNLEDIRRAKSAIGTLLMGTGTGVMMAGPYEQNDKVGLIGLGAVLAGAAVRAGALADTRYCEILPQRVYLVPLTWPADRRTVRLQIEGLAKMHCQVGGLHAAGGDTFHVAYVRMIANDTTPPAWAAATEVLYSNDASPGAAVSRLPYILGGNCVRIPSGEVLADYRRHGLPGHVSLADLETFYRLEGIVIRPSRETPADRHVLEGGRSLRPPAPGTAGFMRLFVQRHPPYHPRSGRVRKLAAELKGAGLTCHMAKDPL